MRPARVPILFCLIVFCTNYRSASADPANQPTNAAKPTPLILEKNDGSGEHGETSWGSGRNLK